MSDRAARIEELRRQNERFLSDLAKETYRAKAGLREGSDVSAVYQRYSAAIGPEATREVGAALEAANRDPGADPDEVRRLRFLYEHLVEQHLGSEVRAITDDLRTREAQARLLLGPGDEVSFRRALVEMANTDDRSRRFAIEERRLAVIEHLTPLLAERFAIARGVARSLGDDSYAGLWERTSGISLDDLDTLMRGFLERTEDMYRDTMGWMVRKRLQIPLEDAYRHDLLALFRGARWDDHFPKQEMVDTARRFLREMGVEFPDGTGIQLDIEPREGKIDRAFCAEIEVPGHVILCLEPLGGRRDWQRFLHELGHALHRAYTSGKEPLEFRRLGDASLAETYAFLFQYLLVDRHWLKRYVKLARPRDYLFLTSLEKLTYLRRYAAKLHYEIQLLRRGDVEGMDEVYEAELGGALGLRYPRELYLYDIDRSFYVARYLRAWLFEALLHKHLVHYFDEDWYRNPRCGRFLKQHWRMGQRLGVEGMVREIGYDKLTTAEVEQELERAL